MTEKNYTGIIPEHIEGTVIDTEFEKIFDNVDDAKKMYGLAREKLLDVNSWNKTAEGISAVFELFDDSKNPVDRNVEKGDYFRIDIPGPGSIAGDGYDWVQVEEVKTVDSDSIQSTGIRVRPVSSPLNDKEEVAHFYSKDATSNFTITREGSKVTAAIYDRNTKVNNDTSGIDQLRATVVGAVGITAFSKIQWKGLVQGLLKENNE
jgi:hypothetical protein